MYMLIISIQDRFVESMIIGNVINLNAINFIPVSTAIITVLCVKNVPNVDCIKCRVDQKYDTHLDALGHVYSPSNFVLA